LVEQSVALKSSCLVSGTDLAWVVTSQEPGILQSMRYGFTSHRSETLTDLLNQRRIQYVGISYILPKMAKLTTPNIIKLDKNFHIYVHSARELIEHGVDEEGRKFYKIYYKEES